MISQLYLAASFPNLAIIIFKTKIKSLLIYGRDNGKTLNGKTK